MSDRGLPTVTVRWGPDWTDEHGRVHSGSRDIRSEAVVRLVDLFADIERQALDGGDPQPGGIFSGEKWPLNAKQATLTGYCLCIKALCQRWFLNYRVPRLIPHEGDEAT